MGLRDRHAIHVVGTGKKDMVMAHGYGCDQNMWRLITPAFLDEYRIVLLDLVGCGQSDLSAYDRDKYATLHGHARDIQEVALECTNGNAVFVGHSVSAMIGLLADIGKPGLFASQVMVGPSPCYINDGDYVGGFSRADIEALLSTATTSAGPARWLPRSWARPSSPRSAKS